MARKKIRVRTKIAASTILEVVVSMVVIVLTYGIAMVIYSNVTHSSLSVKKIRAMAVLQETVRDIERARLITGGRITNGDLTIDISVSAYRDNANLSNINLKAYDASNQEVAALQKVIRRDND
jgi:hypothetical protein